MRLHLPVFYTILFAVLSLLCVSCESGKVPEKSHEATQTTTNVAPTPTEGATSKNSTPNANKEQADKPATAPTPHAKAKGHGHTAPIDCPLRAAGHDPTKMRPFEDVADYIAFLDRPDRATWQKPDDVIAALELSGDEIVADIGAGSGYFSFRFAKLLPRGRVDALDVEPEMVRHLHHKSMVKNIENLHADFADATNPKISEDVNLVFVCDVLHHVPKPQAWLAGIAKQLSGTDQLVLIEFREGALPHGPPEGTKIPRARLIEIAKGAGLELKKEHHDLLPYQYMMTFQLASNIP